MPALLGQALVYGPDAVGQRGDPVGTGLQYRPGRAFDQAGQQ